MPKGYFRQWPAPRDFGFDENQPVPLRVLLGAMVRTWYSRLRAILAPDGPPPDDADEPAEAPEA
jgi:hypothetical protein